MQLVILMSHYDDNVTTGDAMNRSSKTTLAFTDLVFTQTHL
jgi:hypothetical protein